MGKKKVKEKRVFIYHGKNNKGQKTDGEIAAETPAIAKALLRKQGINHAKLSIKRQSFFKKKAAGTRISPTDVAVLARQLSTMQTAGIPLIQALDVVIQGSDKQGFINLVQKIKEEVENGHALSEALGKHPRYFDELFCNLVEAGEQSGTLEAMLDRIALYKERSESLKRKLKKAMYYPVTVLLIASVVTVILLIKVVPTFKDMFAGFGSELPGFTVFVLNISELVQKYGFQLAIGLALVIWTIIWGYKTQRNFRHSCQRIFLKIPVFGEITHKAIIARFARTLSTTFAAGVPLTDALTAVAKASGNIVYFNAIIQIRDNIAAGQQIQVAMQRSGIFPNMVVQMAGIGEESGTLEEMLGKVADIFEEEVNTAVDGLSTLLEPLIMVILGVVVGGLVVAMYLPIFKMGSVI